MSVISFYKGKIPANNKPNYYFQNIVEKWDDYKLEKEHDFIQWLFPDETGGVNSTAPHLTEKDVERFKRKENIRKNVIKATLRMLLFYGYIIDKKFKVRQVRPLFRKENGAIIGLFSTHNYNRLTRMMIFLNRINMNILSALVFLALCKAVKNDDELRKKVVMNNSMKFWKQTQEYIRNFEESTEESPEESEESEESYEESEEKDPECSFSGLNYAGNSCYQDSVLVALLSVSNDFITKNLLEKNIDDITENPVKWIACDNSPEKDSKIRKNIQNELRKITYEIRHKKSDDVTCRNLRKIFSSCKSNQDFYTTKTQDAGEFLQFLFQVFQIYGTVRKTTTYITNDTKADFVKESKVFEKTSEIFEYESPLYIIRAEHLRNHKMIGLENFLTQTEDAIFDRKNLITYNGQKYSRRIAITKLVHAEYLVFYPVRLFHMGNKIVRNTTYIIPPEQLQVDKKVLNLRAIVIHVSNHYTCTIQCNGKWYYYNDNPGGSKFYLKKIASYTDMLKIDPNPAKYGTLYFYV